MSDEAVTTEARVEASKYALRLPERDGGWHPALPPTEEVYCGLQELYDHFNTELFDSRLPPALITLQRKGKYYGYFAARQFGTLADDAIIDEIALNPRHFRERSVEETASTLVHEMTHLAQHHYGQPSRTTYHNKQWAQWMKAIGLYPSSTGKPGGKKTGFRMSHYIMPGGRFEVSFNRFRVSGHVLAWGDLSHAVSPKAKLNRTKYVCDDCDAAVWGKAGLTIACFGCSCKPMAAQP